MCKVAPSWRVARARVRSSTHRGVSSCSQPLMAQRAGEVPRPRSNAYLDRLVLDSIEGTWWLITWSQECGRGRAPLCLECPRASLLRESDRPIGRMPAEEPQIPFALGRHRHYPNQLPENAPWRAPTRPRSADCPCRAAIRDPQPHPDEVPGSCSAGVSLAFRRRIDGPTDAAAARLFREGTSVVSYLLKRSCVAPKGETRNASHADDTSLSHTAHHVRRTRRARRQPQRRTA